MKYAIITVAGMSKRFNENHDIAKLKCIYYEGDERSTLLYNILNRCEGIDKVIIVGGYQYEVLVDYINKFRREFSFDIELIYNPEYYRYGSGYSLFCGLKICYERNDCSEVILIEGDLSFDEETFKKIKVCTKDVITINNDPICSNKAVALYLNEENRIKYIYNTEHGLFYISESFSEIHNSGQVWKIKNREIFQKTFMNLEIEDWRGTNLVFIERYFNSINLSEICFIKFKKWINCNKREDLKLRN